MIKLFTKKTLLRQLPMLARPSGMILVALIIIASILTVIGLSLASYASSQYSVTSRNVFSANAGQVAEAGIEQTVEQLNQNDAFTGYSTDQQFFNNTTQGNGSFTTAVTNITSNAKTITSTSKVYRPNSTKLVSTKQIKVTVVGTQSQGYSVYSGVGGLILGGSANITNSDVFVNGTLTLSGASKIGTNAQPVNVNVANQACPTGSSPGASYPQVCTNTQPITLAQSTNIYGTVCATGQTSKGPNNNNNIQGGTSGQGLVAGCTTPPVAMPSYDRAAHISRMTTTAAGNSNTYVCNNSPFNRTWPANLKLTGNVSVASSCNIVIKGDAYITGDFSLGGAAKITVDESVGTTRPVVVVDGGISIAGSGSLIANSKGTGIEFISFKSGASCGATCTSLSGNDLKTSQGLQTISIGGNVNLPGMVFYAYWGKLTVGGSGNIGAGLGQTVDMSGAGTVTFGTKLAAGARTWTISSYQQNFVH